MRRSRRRKRIRRPERKLKPWSHFAAIIFSVPFRECPELKCSHGRHKILLIACLLLFRLKERYSVVMAHHEEHYHSPQLSPLSPPPRHHPVLMKQYVTLCSAIQLLSLSFSLSLSSSLSLLFSLSSLPFIFMTREFIPALVACDEEAWRRRRIEREVEIYIGPYLSTFSTPSTLEFIPSVRRTTEECDRISPRCEI